MQVEGGQVSDFPKATTSKWQSQEWTPGQLQRLQFSRYGGLLPRVHQGF